MRPYFSAPSQKSLVETFRITKEQAKLVRSLLHGEIRILDNPAFPETNRWVDSCYNRPSYRERLMSALDEIIGGYGVEALWGDDPHWPVASYVNTGDTYSPTLLLNHETGTIRITTWGDFVEKNERKYQIQ